MPVPLVGRVRAETDDDLVRRFRAGDEAAFTRIVERYRPRLVAYAAQMLRQRGPDAAEDVVQDVMLRAYRRLRDDDREMLLRPWLYRIAHNRCIDALRVAAPAEFEAAMVGGRADETHAQREALRDVVADIQALPPRQRSALVIRELAGLSYQEIAEALDVSVGSVKSLLVRARMQLAEAAEARAAEDRAEDDELAARRAAAAAPRLAAA